MARAGITVELLTRTAAELADEIGVTEPRSGLSARLCRWASNSPQVMLPRMPWLLLTTCRFDAWQSMTRYPAESAT